MLDRIIHFLEWGGTVFSTWKNEEYSRDEGQDGALGADVAHITDDEGREDEE